MPRTWPRTAPARPPRWAGRRPSSATAYQIHSATRAHRRRAVRRRAAAGRRAGHRARRALRLRRAGRRLRAGADRRPRGARGRRRPCRLARRAGAASSARRSRPWWRWARSPARMVAAVGPCIGPASYEVGLEFLERSPPPTAPTRGSSRPAPAPTSACSTCRASCSSGWPPPASPSAEWTGRDTFADEERFFSNRRAVHRGEGDYGRLLSAISSRSEQLDEDQLRVARVEVVDDAAASQAGLG